MNFSLSLNQIGSIISCLFKNAFIYLKFYYFLSSFVAGSQDGRTTVLEKERTEVESDEDAEDGGVLGTIKNVVE